MPPFSHIVNYIYYTAILRICQPVGSADSRYAKGTVALTVSICQAHAAVRGSYSATETDGIGSIARERRAGHANGTTKAC